MNFITFSVAGTNIFPLANSRFGGQLMSERNIRTIGSVATETSVKYFIGPSYTHSMDDFALTAFSSTVINVSPGRAIIDGHYVESLLDVQIDLVEANAELKAASMDPLKGTLTVGIRAYYSTEATMAGALIPEDDETDMYQGIQVVILPTDSVITPADSPTDENKVNCHLVLGTFTYLNGSISSVADSPEKIQYIEGSRLKDVNVILSSSYVSKAGLNAKKLYVFAGKGTDSSSEYDTWCDATDSLMVFDSTPQMTTVKPKTSQLYFSTDSDEHVTMIMPHKQVDGMVDSTGNKQYYADKVATLPIADYAQNTPGTVDSTYTKNIKLIAEDLANISQYVKGKQVYFIEELKSKDDLPEINPAWDIGDYVLVGTDHTTTISNDDARHPSTMYCVIPGHVRNYIYFGTGEEDSNDYPLGLQGETLTGVKLEDVIVKEMPVTIVTATDKAFVQRVENVPVLPGSTITLTYVPSDKGTPEDPTPYQYIIYPEWINYATGEIDMAAVVERYPDLAELTRAVASYEYVGSAANGPIEDYGEFRGEVGVDFFVATYQYSTNNEDGTKSSHYRKFYYVVYETFPNDWSPTLPLTGDIQFATEVLTGGFRNIPDTLTDAGYVRMNEYGYLQLLDYSLLRSGTLAYQIGEDLTLPSGISAIDCQTYLDEYVNNRVAFPNGIQLTTSTTPNVINLYIDLVAESEPASIVIRNIDSRFNTSLYIHFTGSADTNTVISILDCEKVRIDNNIEGSPIINIYRTELYYDPALFNYIRQCDRTDKLEFTGFEGLRLWYDVYESTDAHLIVNDMTVTELNEPIETEDIDFWSSRTANDNHYLVALKDITFSEEGDIIGAGLLISDASTNNNTVGQTIMLGEFTLPQSSGLTYPQSCLTRPIKVTGAFTCAYYDAVDAYWIVSTTQVSLLTEAYDIYNLTQTVSGSIAINTTVATVEADLGPDVEAGGITAWEPNGFNYFQGTATSKY